MRFPTFFLALLLAASAHAELIGPDGNSGQAACYDGNLAIVPCKATGSEGALAEHAKRLGRERSADARGDGQSEFDFAALAESINASLPPTHACASDTAGFGNSSANRFFCTVLDAVAAAAGERQIKDSASGKDGGPAGPHAVARYSLSDRELAQSVKGLKSQLDWDSGGESGARNPVVASPQEKQQSRAGVASHRPDPLIAWFIEFLDGIKSAVAGAINFFVGLFGR